MNAPARPRPQRRRAVRREQLSDEVAARLRADIMTGTLRPGTFIRLDETAAALGVSITPVREALRTLRGEGMVQLEPHRGHVVVPLAARRHRGHLLAAGHDRQGARGDGRRTNHRRTRSRSWSGSTTSLAAAVDRGDPEEVVAAEFAFHRAFNRVTGRIKLAWFLLHVARYLPGQIYASDAAWGAAAVAGHRELIEALRRRDVDTVVRLTRRRVHRRPRSDWSRGSMRSGLWS